MKRETLDESLSDVKILLAIPHRYTIDPYSWWMPSDVLPHSPQFKRKCVKLCKAGLLERRGDGSSRWGYSYRLPLLSQRR